MAKELMTYIFVFVSTVVFSQQEPLCSYRRTQGDDNTTRIISNGTIEEEGRLFITWNKVCGSESLRFVCEGSCFVALSIVETFPSLSCSNIYVLDSLAQGYIGVIHTCPARMLGEFFEGKEIQLWFERLGNDSVKFEVNFSSYPSISTGSTGLNSSSGERLQFSSILARNNPQTLTFSVEESYYPGTTIWTISTSSLSDHKVSVRVLQADDTDCTATEVRVYDGWSMSEKSLLGSFCDSRPFFLSSAGSLTVVFHTNLTRPSGRFLLSYAQVPETFASLPCNSTFNLWGQLNVTSPGFPNLYPDRLDCWWLFRAPKGANIIVQSQSFLLQPPSGSAPCTDWLAIYNTEDNSSALLDKVCGSRNISGIFTQDSLLVWFHSEDNFTASGFKLTITPRDPDGRLYCDPDHVKKVVLEQGRYEFTLQAPGCFMQLRASGQVVRLWSSNVDPESVSSCKNLSVYDGPTKAYPQLSHWCGDTALDVRSTGKFMYIEYHEVGASVQLFAFSENSTSTRISPSSPGLFAGVVLPAVLASIIFCFLSIVFSVCHKKRLCVRICCRQRNQQTERPSTVRIQHPTVSLPPQNSRRRRPSMSERMATVSERVMQRFFAPPPSYEAAVSGPRGAPPPPYSTVAENRVSQELPPLDQDDKPPAYSDVGMEVE